MSVERARGFRSAAILFGCLCLLAAIFYSPLLDLISTPAAAAQSGQAINLRAEVDLVTVPVVALDKKGKPVTNLTKDSFQLYEDGKKQEILSFDAVTEEPAGPSSLNAPVIENAESSHGKIVFIVFDDSTIKTANIKKARDSAETFVSQHMKPGDLFAVASYGYGMKLLQNFTNDSDKVSKAIAQPAVSTANSSSSPGGYVDGSLPQFGRQRDLDPTNTSLKYQAEGLLKALQAINASIERIRGQKSVLVFSESSFLDPNTAQKVLPEVLTSAKRSGVVYYTVDPGGL